MSDIKTKEKEISDLIDKLFNSKAKIIKKSGRLKKLVPANYVIEDKENSKKIMEKMEADDIVDQKSQQYTDPSKDKLLTDILQNYKFDDSALLAGRRVVSYRSIGDKVNPENMTYKEYINHLCFIYNFKVGHPWDGIERKPHRPNWTPEPNFNIQNREGALKFLNIKQSKKAPDGMERRAQGQRRTGQSDIRNNRVERRLAKERRTLEKRQESQANIIHLITLILGMATYAFLWSIAK